MNKLILVLFLILTGCTLWRPAAPHAQPQNGPGQDFTRVEIENLPEPVQTWAENARTMHLGHDLVFEGKRYISVGYGEKPTGGYGVSIEDVVVADGVVTVTANFTRPGPGQIVTDALTYPQDIISITDLTRPLEFAATGSEEYVPQLRGLEQLRKITSQSQGIKVFEPASNSEVGQTFNVRGVANVFEGTVLWRLNHQDLALIEGLTTAGMGDWTFYEFAVSVPTGTGNRACLELFTESAEDGSEQNLVAVPLNISID